MIPLNELLILKKGWNILILCLTFIIATVGSFVFIAVKSSACCAPFGRPNAFLKVFNESVLLLCLLTASKTIAFNSLIFPGKLYVSRRVYNWGGILEIFIPISWEAWFMKWCMRTGKSSNRSLKGGTLIS